MLIMPVLILAIASRCAEEDVSLVLGIVGSLLGCGVAYVIPGLLQLSSVRRQRMAGVSTGVFSSVVGASLVVGGVAFAALGTWITLATPAHH